MLMYKGQAKDTIKTKLYGNAEALRKTLMGAKNGKQQLACINTLIHLDEQGAGTNYSDWQFRICQTLRQKVNQFGDKSYPLSEKQVNILCDEWDAFWAVELHRENA